MIVFQMTKQLFKHSSFKSPKGKNEYFISIGSEKSSDFSQSLENIYKSYISNLEKLSLSGDTQVFSRFYLSDIANQKDALLKSKIFLLSQKGAYSIIQQCPLDGSDISILSYHIEKPGEKEKINFEDSWKNGLKTKGVNYNLYYTGNFYSNIPLGPSGQTNEIFSSYNSFLEENKMTLMGNAVRTWIYVRDIDNNYNGMVAARKKYFEKKGLTKETRYIASTGIEARLREASVLVSMDAISVSGLDPAQIIRMEAREHMNPTHEYGVTFERGTKIEFGDRSHMYISGTASINNKGEVIHIGDVGSQTKRILENIRALLNPHGADIKDMACLIVYARNITQTEEIMKAIKEEGIDHIPLIFAEGAVCRPTWLVEIEGVAIIPSKTNWPDFY